jgi:large subunit ribosomal protein L22
MITARLKNQRTSPRKMRLVVDAIRGKKVDDALVRLSLITKRATDPLAKLIKSAIANAKNVGVDTSDLIVKEVRVDGGIVMKRSMPRARGSAYPIRKRTSHVLVVLDKKHEKKSKITKVTKDNKSNK